MPAYAAEIKAEKPAPDPVKEESPAEPKEPKKAPAKKKTAGRKKKEA